MATKIIMPKLGLTMVEGTIIRWLKNEGEEIEKDELLLEVQSDKSSFEVEASDSGILRAILKEEGAVVPCGEMIGVIAAIDEDISAFLENEKVSKEEINEKVVTSKEPMVKKEINRTGRIFISPRAKKLANTHNIEYSQINGTGPNGRIIEKDVQDFIEQKDKVKITPLAAKIVLEKGIDVSDIKGSGVSGRIYKDDLSLKVVEEVISTKEDDVVLVPYKGMRKVIGDRLSQSKFTSPHLYFTISIDMTKAQEIRSSYKKYNEKVSYNDIVLYVVSRALRRHPMLNTSLKGDNIHYFNYVNLGMAVALEDGLIVPVIRNAHVKSLREIVSETRLLAQKARENKLTPDEYKGGTFTVSNLGMTGIDNFTAIINPPESAILSVSAIKKMAVVNQETDEIEIKPMMNVTVSVDHRIIDGMSAAQFLQTIKKYLEDPYSLL